MKVARNKARKAVRRAQNVIKTAEGAGAGAAVAAEAEAVVVIGVMVAEKEEKRRKNLIHIMLEVVASEAEVEAGATLEPKRKNPLKAKRIEKIDIVERTAYHQVKMRKEAKMKQVLMEVQDGGQNTTTPSAKSEN